MRLRVLVTRPAADARRTARALIRAGHVPVVAPVLTVRTLTPPALTGGQVESAQGLVVTSRNAASRLPGTLDRSMPALAVGDSTAAALARAGFTDVTSAGGDARDLARLAEDRFSPEGRPVLYPCGRQRTGRLAERLRAAGFETVVWEVYETRPLALPPPVRAGLARGRVRAVLLYSPRSATAFARAVGGQTVGAELVCLSWQVAQALPDRLARRAVWPARPSEAALLGLLDAANFTGTGGSS